MSCGIHDVVKKKQLDANKMLQKCSTSFVFTLFDIFSILQVIGKGKPTIMVASRVFKTKLTLNKLLVPPATKLKVKSNSSYLEIYKMMIH